VSSHFKSEPSDQAETVEALLTYRQAAKVLGVTERTIWTLVDRCAVRVVRFGRSVRIDPADLRGFIERAKQGGAERVVGAAQSELDRAHDGGDS